MRASSETYEVVAKNCSAFTAKDQKDSYTSSTSSNCCEVSCVNCKHFDNDSYCRLDLYDQIVRDHGISC